MKVVTYIYYEYIYNYATKYRSEVRNYKIFRGVENMR
jgi:hypothetical protein